MDGQQLNGLNNIKRNNMNTPTKQTVYLPINNKEVKRYSKHVIDCEECEGLIDDEHYTCTYCWHEGGDGKLHFDDLFKEQQAFVFSSEQLNEYTQGVIKQALETAADRAEINDYDEHEQYSPHIDTTSITNTFEETYKQFEV
jgi:hypothetical protein